MKISLLLISICIFLSLPVLAQQNNTLRGKILFLSSGKTPAVGVEISGTVEKREKTNMVYTTDDGSYNLVFPKARDGHRVNLKIGTEDKDGKSIEVVNNKEVGICQISAKISVEFNIIVCQKGARDLAAQKYYNIIKTSSDIALSKKKKEIDVLLAQQKKDYQKIAELGERIAKLEKQTDSLVIYKEAFHIASINRDNASKRVLRYVQLLGEGKSIQEAREVLSIRAAASDLDKSITLFKAAIKELEIRAGASLTIFDYKDAITCYDIIIAYSERMEIDPLKISEHYLQIANIYFKNGNYKKSLEYLQESNDIRKKILDPKHLDLATVYINISKTHDMLGQYEKAVKYSQKAIVIIEKTLDSKHPDLAIAYQTISVTLHSLGQYEKALEYNQKAIAIIEKTLGSKHPDLAITFASIGQSYQFLGQNEKALEYLQKAVALQEEILDPKHLNLATSYEIIGNVLRNLGQYEKALEYQLKSISIKEEILRPKHFKFSSLYSNIGATYHASEQYEKALEYLQKSIDLGEEILDPKHPDLAIDYNNISAIYQSLGQYEKALEYNQKAIVIMEATLNPKHPDLATSYNNISMVYQDLKQYEKALEYNQKAINIQEEILAPNHFSLGISYNNIAFTYQAMKEFDKAIEFQEKCLNVFKATLPENHPFQQKVFNRWLKIYYAKALDAFDKKDYISALADFDTIHIFADSSFVYYGNVWNYTGVCHFTLGNYPKAIEAYQQAVVFLPELKQKDFYNDIGLSYAKNYQFKEAYVAFTEYEKLFPNEGRAYLSWAMYYALQKEKEKTFTHLQKAIELGYNNVKWLKTDDSMEWLRKEKVFIEIIEKLEKENNK